MLKTFDLFATPIALVDDLYPDCQQIVQSAYVIVGDNKTPAMWLCDINSTYSTLATSIDLLPSLKQYVHKAANEYSNLHWNKQCMFVNSWVNIANSYHYQEQHHHIGVNQQIKFCAIYYPQVQENEKLIFHTPFVSIFSFNGKDKVFVNIRNNMLVLFPAYLEHSFRSIHRDVDKISIACNFKLIPDN